MTLGQAAGTAAALSLQTNVLPRALDAQALRERLDRRRRRSAPPGGGPCLIRARSPRERGIAIELADLGSWGDATLVSEYDPAGPVIRINTRAIPPGSSCDVREHIDRAVAHELYHHAEATGEVGQAREP